MLNSPWARHVLVVPYYHIWTHLLTLLSTGLYFLLTSEERWQKLGLANSVLDSELMLLFCLYCGAPVLRILGIPWPLGLLCYHLRCYNDASWIVPQPFNVWEFTLTFTHTSVYRFFCTSFCALFFTCFMVARAPSLLLSSTFI